MKTNALMSLLINGELVDDSVIRQETSVLRQQYAGSLEGDPVEIEMRLREQARHNVIQRVLVRQEAARDPAPLDPEQVEKALEGVLAQSAVKAGCDPRSSEDDLRREIEARLRVERFLDGIINKLPWPKQKDVGDYYRKHREDFKIPEMIRAAHIVKNVDETTNEEAALAAIREVQAQLTSDNFAELANEHSDCKGNGGDLGFFPRGQMVDEFDEVVFGLQPGETSDVFRTPFGFHIARMVERRPPGVRSLPEVKKEIEDMLFQQKMRRTVDEMVARLEAKADIQNVRQKIQA
jgi:parvulin-like peptidyl-prolyl isomerase